MTKSRLRPHTQMETMAMSILDAQRNAAALAANNKKRDDVERSSLTMSPPASANNSSNMIYPGFPAANALGMLTPQQLIAANQHAAAAFMASQIPNMTQLASLFPPHAFLAWPNGLPHLPLASGPHSPPASPDSQQQQPPHHHQQQKHQPPHSTPSRDIKHPLSPSSANSHYEMPVKKARKMTLHKKELDMSAAIDIPFNNNNVMFSSPAGPISPPSSGSSPNSAHEVHSSSTNLLTGNVITTTTSTTTTKDPSRDKSFTCKICARSFGYKHVLQNHERTHTGEKPFECPECHKRFTRDHHLKTHMRLHTGEKPYHCSHCDRQFVQVANLRRHLRVHTGERPYTCEICDGKFSDSNQLKSHMLVHNGEKPFECDRCHLKVRRRHNLLNHKCSNSSGVGITLQSPPTSPCDVISVGGDYALCDQKSAMGSSYGSEESMDVGHRTTTGGISSAYELSLHQHLQHNVSAADTSISAVATEDEEEDEAPLDLSENEPSIELRKPHDIRRLFRLPAQIMRITRSDLPEQTEPEDLSINRKGSRSPESMLLMPNDDDIDMEELDDAASLYERHQQQLAAFKSSIKME